MAKSKKPSATRTRASATRTRASAKPTKASARPPKASSRPTEASAPRTSSAAARTSSATAPAAADGWLDAGKGYALTLEAGKLVARNDKGKRLASVPKELRESDAADQLEGLRDWLVEHERECAATVEQWMLRSLAVPRAVLEAVWEDPAWRAPLENAVVVAGDRAGLFRGVDPRKGVGIVDLDGETGWLAAERVAIPHPILIPELDGWRELVTQLSAKQGVAQLHRETHAKPVALAEASTSIDAFEDGKFAMLMHAIGKARSLGFKVRGGFATCRVWDGGGVSEARYWIGADSPDSETYTGHLSWVDARERSLLLGDVGPVAFSEGMRMASAIYAARIVEKPEAP